MTNFKLTIQYDGGRYNGWQRLGNTDNTIQGKIERVLSEMTGHAVEIHGAGRTDAGVHAAAQVASFKLNTTRSPEEIRAYLNHYLPQDIGILSCEHAQERFHARLHAKGKHYTYRLWCSDVPNVFERRYLTAWDKSLDVQRMREAAALLSGTHDYRAFSSVNKRFKKSTVRTVERIEVTEHGGEIRLDFFGDGFLYHMVRILSGTLVEIGAGERELDNIPRAFETLDRQDAGITMPPQGLILTKIFY